MTKETFFTPYQRQNHTDIYPNPKWSLSCIFFNRKNMLILESVKPKQTVSRRYLLEADYEYNPELIEV